MIGQYFSFNRSKKHQGKLPTSKQMKIVFCPKANRFI